MFDWEMAGSDLDSASNVWLGNGLLACGIVVQGHETECCACDFSHLFARNFSRIFRNMRRAFRKRNQK